VTPPHPLISYGTPATIDESSQTKTHIRGLVKRALGDCSNETGLTRVSGGSGRSEQNRRVFFKPHNYRVYYDFNISGFVVDLKDPGVRGLGGVGYKLINSGHDHSFKSFMGCRIVVRRKTIEINNRISVERWHPIALSGDVQAQFERIIVEKDSQCLRVLQSFVERFGGSSDEVVVNVHSENKLMGEDAIDRIPLKMKFHTDSVKKVYNEKNVEFDTPAEAANYLENRALERFSPVIVEQLEAIRVAVMSPVKSFVTPLESLKMDVRVFPDDVLERESEVLRLSDDDRVEFTDWLFDEFGGVSNA